MIPVSLVEEEERYQQSFRKHYLETHVVYLKESHINECFLGDP